MSKANYTETAEPGSRTNGCLGCFALLLIVGASALASLPVKGFWLSVGMFMTVFFGGFIGVGIGSSVGSKIRNFLAPRFIRVDGGAGEIANAKLFWLAVPQLTGIILGWAIGVHLLLLLFWGMPLTALGSGLYVSDEKTPTLGERLKRAKEAGDFVEKMSKADHKTKVDALLMVGIDAGSVVTVEEAIRQGAVLNTPRQLLDKNGLPYRNERPMSPLFAALSGEFSSGEEIALILLKHGADANVRDDFFKGPTPLLYVLRNNMTSLVVPLIEHGAKLDVVDVDGKTPLHYVMNLGLEKAVAMMLERGASLTAKDRWGHTPLDYATSDLGRKVRLLQRQRER